MREETITRNKRRPFPAVFFLVYFILSRTSASALSEECLVYERLLLLLLFAGGMQLSVGLSVCHC